MQTAATRGELWLSFSGVFTTVATWRSDSQTFDLQGKLLQGTLEADGSLRLASVTLADDLSLRAEDARAQQAHVLQKRREDVRLVQQDLLALECKLSSYLISLNLRFFPANFAHFRFRFFDENCGIGRLQSFFLATEDKGKSVREETQEPQRMTNNQSNNNSVIREVGGMFGGCFENIPAGTRYLSYTLLGGSVLGLFISPYTENCPFYITGKSWLNIYRLFISSWFGDSFFTSLFAMFTIYQVGPRLEAKKGTVFLLFAWVLLTLLSNALFLLVVSLMFYNSLAPYLEAMYMCSAGSWPALFGMIAIETQMDPTPTRKFFCFPCDVPTKAYPWVLLLVFQFLFSNGSGASYLNPYLLLGLLSGYLLLWLPSLQLSVERTRRLEMAEWLRKIVTARGFISIGSANLVVPWTPYDHPSVASGQGGAASRSGAWGDSNGTSSSSGSGPFSSRGYSLTSSSSSNPPPATGLDEHSGRVRRDMLAERALARLGGSEAVRTARQQSAGSGGDMTEDHDELGDDEDEDVEQPLIRGGSSSDPSPATSSEAAEPRSLGFTKKDVTIRDAQQLHNGDEQ
eukprot:g1443.t1